jgi:hypothetical protein
VLNWPSHTGARRSASGAKQAKQKKEAREAGRAEQAAAATERAEAFAVGKLECRLCCVDP